MELMAISSSMAAEQLLITGVVQGVGFRPFVFRLANELGLSGEVGNSDTEVFVRVAGSATVIDAFVTRLRDDAPNARTLIRHTPKDLATICAKCLEREPSDRYPNCTGISQTSDPLPVEFSQTKNVRWASDVGDGVGCPVVAAGRVFVSGEVDEKTIGLFAFDAKTEQFAGEGSGPANMLLKRQNENQYSVTAKV